MLNCKIETTDEKLKIEMVRSKSVVLRQKRNSKYRNNSEKKSIEFYVKEV